MRDDRKCGMNRKAASPLADYAPRAVASMVARRRAGPRTAGTLRRLISVGCLLVGCCCFPAAADEPAVRRALERGSAYLVDELRTWDRDNRCATCHNHGQGGRAIFAAAQQKLGPSLDRLPDDYLALLANPAAWQLQEATPGGDQKLADLHYARALLAAARVPDVARQLTPPRGEIAARLARHQESDGSWPRDPTSELGTPLTFGSALGTALMRETLQAFAAQEQRENIDQATAWLLRQQPQNIVTASALVLGLQDVPTAEADALRARCRRLLSTGQATEGGWGPYVQAPPEPFDTALAVLALASAPASWEPERSTRWAGGREFLVREQLPSGGWRETTRPAGRDSYAQHIATTAWAVEALAASLADEP